MPIRVLDLAENLIRLSGLEPMGKGDRLLFLPLMKGNAKIQDLTPNRPNLRLATDDGLTIKACKILDVEFLTAIHFLLWAQEQGTINRELALTKLEKLEKFGRYRL